MTKSTQRIYLELSDEDGIGTLTLGNKTYDCGGDPDFDYPSDSTIRGKDKEYCHHSREYDVDMYYAVLWDGTAGTYFHEWETLEGSAGCIHLLEGDAEVHNHTFFYLNYNYN